MRLSSKILVVYLNWTDSITTYILSHLVTLYYLLWALPKHMPLCKTQYVHTPYKMNRTCQSACYCYYTNPSPPPNPLPLSMVMKFQVYIISTLIQFKGFLLLLLQSFYYMILFDKQTKYTNNMMYFQSAKHTFLHSWYIKKHYLILNSFPRFEITDAHFTIFSIS